MKKSPSRGLVEKRAKAIKAFVSFNVRDTKIKPKSLADKIRRYHQLIYGTAGEPGLFNPATDVAMKPRGKRAFDALRESEGQPAHKGIKVVFVETVEDPTNPDKLLKPGIRIRNGKVHKSNFDITQSFYPFKINLRKNIDIDEAFEADVKRILREAPHVTEFVVKCGKRQTANPKPRSRIAAYVLYLLHKYRDTASDWLRGLVAIEFKTTAGLHAFLAERDKLRKGKSGRKARRRNRR